MLRRLTRNRDSDPGERRRSADVLVVCTGNICRSPYVATVLDNALPGLTVGSAGTNAVVGMAPVPPVVTALDERGLPMPPPGRQLRRPMIRSARLVLTMTRAHRGAVLTLVPRAADRTFTLKELARVSTGLRTTSEDPLGRLDELITHATAEIARSTRDHDDDLEDPYGGPLEGYTAMMTGADRAMRVIVEALRGRADR